MTRRRLHRLLLAALAVVSGSCSPGPPARSLLFITLDTTRADFLSCLGGEAGTTPHLDSLAERSALFANARSETNVTNPSHLTMLSGLPAIHHGILHNAARLPPELDTLPEAFQRAGFATAAFGGVAHLMQGLGWRGFDTMPRVKGLPSAAEVAEQALEWLESAAAHPFFLWVHFFDPHFSYTPPKELRKLFYEGDPRAGDGPLLVSAPYFRIYPDLGYLHGVRDPGWPRAMYAAEIHAVDQQVGRVLAKLEALGLADDTAIVVVADHGESLGEHGLYYTHRGIYEQQLRIPLIVHVPGLPPTRSDADVGTLDLAPTVKELMGIELAHPLPGISLVPLLRGEELPALDERRVHVHQNAHNNGVAVRSGRWKLIWGIDPEHPVLGRPPQLFDLVDDPQERIDLAAREPERVAELRELAEPWIRLGVQKAGRLSDLGKPEIEALRELGYLEE